MVLASYSEENSPRDRARGHLFEVQTFMNAYSEQLGFVVFSYKALSKLIHLKNEI